MLTYKIDHHAELGEVDKTRLGLRRDDLFDLDTMISRRRGEKGVHQNMCKIEDTRGRRCLTYGQSVWEASSRL